MKQWLKEFEEAAGVPAHIALIQWMAKLFGMSLAIVVKTAIVVCVLRWMGVPI